MVSGARSVVVAAAVVLALAVPVAPAAAQAETCSPAPCVQPDANIRRGNESASIGEDLYNADSLGQTRVALVRREGVVQFFEGLSNDGTEQDDLLVQGTRNTPYFFIRYFSGGQEISARVRAGVQRFPDVGAGGRRTVRVEIEARAAAPVRSRVVARLTVSSGTDPAILDRVKAVVYRSRGVETPIEGRTWTNRQTGQRWAQDNDATARFVRNAILYWDLASSRGIRPEVAYAQSAKETAYGHFGGVIDETWMNPCGLKTTQGGDNGDPDAHQRFTSWRQGVTACLDHLALYAGAPGYPRAHTPDPRHFPSIYAVAPTVERLGGRWAPAPDYGTSIVNDYLNPLLGS